MILRKLLRAGLWGTSAVLFIIYIMALFAGFLNPAYFYFIALLGLGFPIIYVLHLLNTLLNFRNRKWFLFLVTFLLIGSPLILRHFSLPLKSNSKIGEYSLISYNVQGFYTLDAEDTPSQKSVVLKDILDGETTLIFFQEFRFGKLKENELLFKQYPFHFPEKGPGTDYLFSRFPLTNGGTLTADGEDFAVYADAEFPGQTIRLINVHLRSIMLTRERELLQPSADKTLQRSTVRKLIRTLRKLKIAFKYRTDEISKLMVLIEESPHPVLLAGDFNDTPASYAYHRVNSKLSDASFLRRYGWKRTFVESTFPLRIDHIFTSDDIRVTQYERMSMDYSDHYPVSVSFDLH